MQEFERERLRDWLEGMRGDRSQEAFARDITAVTGWTITRDRYSKYESGSLPFGRAVLGHFLDYAERTGYPAPDLTPPPPPEPELTIEERTVRALEQANRIAARQLATDRLRMRAERAQADALSTIAQAFVAGPEGHSFGDTFVSVIRSLQAFAEAQGTPQLPEVPAP